MSFWLARYVGSGTDTDPFRPSGADELARWSSIDLRPDSSSVEGFAFLRGDGSLPARAGLFALGDDLDEPSVVSKAAIESRLGVTISETRGLRRIIRELLVAHGSTSDPRRWNPLRPEGGRYRVYLGGLIDDWPVVAGGATITESFNKANSSTLGPDLTWSEVENDLTIVSNAARVVTLNTVCSARAQSDLASADHYAQITATTLGGTTGQRTFSACVRFNSGATTYYAARARFDTGATNLQKVVAGVVTTLGSGTSDAWASGDIVRCSIIGSTLASYRNNVLRESITDTAITANLRTGFGVRASTASDVVVDNFQASDIVLSSVNLTVAAVALSAESLTPVPQPITVNLTPATMALVGVTLTAVPQPVTTSLSAASAAFSAVAVDPVPQPVTVALSAAGVALSAEPVTPEPQPVAVVIASAVLVFTAVETTPVPQPITVDLTAAELVLEAVELEFASAVSVDLAPAVVTLAGVSLDPVPQPVTVNLTVAALTMAGVTLDPDAQPVTVSLVAASFSVNAVAVSPVPQPVVVALTSSVLVLTAPPCTAVPGVVEITLTPAVLVLVAIAGLLKDRNPRQVSYTEPTFSIVNREPSVTHRDQTPDVTHRDPADLNVRESDLVYQEG